MNRRTINKQKLQLIFTCETEYEMYRREYYVLWISEGNKIIDTFEIITHLPFIEREIKVKVGKGDKYGNNYAGERIREPMLFRYNIRNKAGTLMHELGHRLIMEHDLFNKSKNTFYLQDLHQILNLFLFDVMQRLYGTEAALFRVEYEKSFPDAKYAIYWEEALKLTFEERTSLLKNIVKFCFSL